MIDNLFRSRLPAYVRPLIRLYGRLGITPNQLTVVGFLIACAAGLCVALGWNLAAIVVWWLSRLADGTDGIYARQTGQTSGFGAYLDILLDMASYGVVVLGLAVAYPDLGERWMAMLFLYVLCITSALALGMEELRRGFEPRDDRGLRLGAGLAEGGETGIAYTLFLLFPSGLPVLTAVWIAILAVTVVARTALAARSLGGEA